MQKNPILKGFFSIFFLLQKAYIMSGKLLQEEVQINLNRMKINIINSRTKNYTFCYFGKNIENKYNVIIIH